MTLWTEVAFQNNPQIREKSSNSPIHLVNLAEKGEIVFFDSCNSLVDTSVYIRLCDKLSISYVIILV